MLFFLGPADVEARLLSVLLNLLEGCFFKSVKCFTSVTYSASPYDYIIQNQVKLIQLSLILHLYLNGIALCIYNSTHPLICVKLVLLEVIPKLIQSTEASCM